MLGTIDPEPIGRLHPLLPLNKHDQTVGLMLLARGVS